LRDVERLSTEETAQALDLSEGTVKARVHRARLQLQKKLSQSFRRELHEGGACNYSGTYPYTCTEGSFE